MIVITDNFKDRMSHADHKVSVIQDIKERIMKSSGIKDEAYAEELARRWINNSS